MKQSLILILSAFFLFSCGGDEKKPEETMKEFISTSNAKKDISSFTNSASISEDYLETRILAEKLNPEKINCETEEETAVCICETESGKKRKFHLIKNENDWLIDITAPEIIVELFHIHYNSINLKAAKKYASVTELDRLNIFETLLEVKEFDASKVSLTPFEIKCKEYKKKFECNCKSDEGETAYILFKTSKGWKAELAETNVSTNDSLIDYNSSENFNLNQHDLDSLTDFSQKMLDSMLNL